MLPKLHPEMIATVKEKIEIEEIISEYVVLKRSGKELVGLCPFHQEKTPSFSVSPAKNFYYCYGCQAGGDALSFLMQIGGFKFTEAVLSLAERYNVPVQTLEPDKAEEVANSLAAKKINYRLMTDAQEFFVHHIKYSAGAREYLFNREFDQSVIDTHGLGFSPAGESLWKYLFKKGYDKELTNSVGLTIDRQGVTVAFLGDRLIIPIYDTQGRIIAFSGRSLDPNVKSNKYINIRESEIFHKKNCVFGLDKAWSAIAQKDEVIIVEGYFDVIRLNSAGILNSVASMGTAVSPAQIKLVSRYTKSKRIVLGLDGDTAGTLAIQETLKKIPDMTVTCTTHILQLPTFYKDSDSFVQKNSPESFLRIVESAPLWVQWQIDQLIAEMNSAQDRNPNSYVMLSLQRRLEEFLKSLTGTTRIMYTEYAATALGLVSDPRKYYISSILGSQKREPATKEKAPGVEQGNSLHSAEALLLSLLLNNFAVFNSFVPIVEQTGISFLTQINQLIWEKIKLEFQKNYTETNFPSLKPTIYQYCLEELEQAPFDVFYNKETDVFLIPKALAYLEISFREKSMIAYADEWEKAFESEDYEQAEKYNNLVISDRARLQEIHDFLAKK